MKLSDLVAHPPLVDTPRLATNRSFYAMLLVALIGMGFAAIGIMNGLNRLASAGRGVELGYQRIAAVEAVLTLARDAETGQRGFLLTGQDKFLEPLNDAAQRTPAVWGQLQRVTNGESHNAIRQMRQTFDEKSRLNRESIFLARAYGLGRAQQFADAGTGKAKMDQLRQEVGRFVQLERGRLNRLKADTDRAYREALVQAALGSFGLILAGALLYAAIREARRAAGKSAAELAASQARLKRLHDELAHIGRVNDLGEMAAAIAHEVNQPLTALSNYLSVGRRMAMTSDEVGNALTDILNRANEQALRAGLIIRRMRSMVERRDEARSLERPAPLIEEAIELTRIGPSHQKAEILYNRTSDEPLLLVDPIQFQQVLVILMRNAIEAFGRTGQSGTLRIVITTGYETDHELWRIDIADNGPGLPPDLAERVFQPFVTSKPGNMGMGLSIAKRIIEQQDGQLALTRNEGGATFSIYLPPATVES